MKFALLWIAVVFIASLTIIRFSPLWEGASAQLPKSRDPTAPMKLWLGDELPSSKLRVHRDEGQQK